MTRDSRNKHHNFENILGDIFLITDNNISPLFDRGLQRILFTPYSPFIYAQNAKSAIQAPYSFDDLVPYLFNCFLPDYHEHSTKEKVSILQLP